MWYNDDNFIHVESWLAYVEKVAMNIVSITNGWIVNWTLESVADTTNVQKSISENLYIDKIALRSIITLRENKQYPPWKGAWFWQT